MMDGAAEGAERFTPYDDEYPSCVSTATALEVCCHASDWEHLAGVLDIIPGGAWMPQSPVVCGSKGTLGQSLRLWTLSSATEVSSLDTRRHLDWLLPRLERHSDLLLRLQSMTAVSVRLAIEWWSRGDGGPTMWPVHLSRMAALNLPCCFDFRFMDEGDSG